VNAAVVDMLRDGATRDDVQSYLQRVEVEQMRLGSHGDRGPVAQAMVDW
jgi:hypothetical protein